MLSRGQSGQLPVGMWVENQYVQDRTDAELIGQKVGWALREGGFGGESDLTAYVRTVEPCLD